MEYSRSITLEKIMPEYCLYRLHADNHVMDRIDIDESDDDAAIAEAIRMDHAHCIEIWCEKRMVLRVSPRIRPATHV